jgi:hypothetical protein
MQSYTHCTPDTPISRAVSGEAHAHAHHPNASLRVSRVVMRGEERTSFSESFSESSSLSKKSPTYVQSSPRTYVCVCV